MGIFRTTQFGNTTQANSSSLVATASITTVDNPVLNAIVPKFATMQPLGTFISTSFTGTSNASVADGTYYDLSLESEREMIDYERRVFSKSNEGANKSLTIKTQLSASNKYISPVIDLSRKSALIIDNILNNDDTNEYTRYGNAQAKYISKPIVLADGQDAEDIKVYVTGYRPINTDIEVYVKFLNAEDTAPLTDKVWTKLTNDGASVYCSPLNPLDFKEYTFSLPTSAPVTYAAYANQSNYGIIRYSDANGQVYNTYKTFAIKVVLLSTDGTYVPKVDDLRAIALQV